MHTKNNLRANLATHSKSVYYSYLAKNQQKKVGYDHYNIFLCSLFN